MTATTRDAEGKVEEQAHDPTVGNRFDCWLAGIRRRVRTSRDTSRASALVPSTAHLAQPEGARTPARAGVGPCLPSTSRLAGAFPAIITHDQRIDPELDRQRTRGIAAHARCAMPFRASSTSPRRPGHVTVPPNARP